MPLSADDIKRAFAALSTELARGGERAELVIAGGAALVLLFNDARLLLSQMDGSANDIWARLEPFVPPHQIAKASYAFDDLWESIHGSS